MQGSFVAKYMYVYCETIYEGFPFEIKDIVNLMALISSRMKCSALYWKKNEMVREIKHL